MKRVILSVLFFLTIGSFWVAWAQNAKIGVISDLHYTHPDLIVEKGRALDNYLQHDRKLLLESDAILRKAVENLLRENVNVVLIPGDLTKDGELVSHQGVARLLSPLTEKGVKVLVVPGNHDIDNPSAVSFHGDETRKVESITPRDFKEIYKKYGYDSAISFDKHSLSYVNEPVDGLRVICIDACKYYDNTFVSRGARRDSCVTNGAIQPETMRWIKTEIQVAKRLGKQIIGMMHHGVVEHFDYQSFLAKPYLADDFEWVQKSFMEAGLNVVFTGHFHASDISKANDGKGNYLYDIETGSTVTYPCPYRIIDIVDNRLDIQTKFIEDIDYPLPSGTDFQTHARNMIYAGFSEMGASLINEYYSTLPDYLPKWLKPIARFPDPETLTEMIISNLSRPASDMLVAHYGGNEHRVENAERYEQELLASIDNFVHQLSKELLGGGVSGIAAYFMLRGTTVKRIKAAVSSIWENTILENKNSTEYAFMNKSINDLDYILTLQYNNINNEHFYAEKNVNDEVKEELLNKHRNDDENGQQILHENRFAVLSRKIDIASE